MLKRLSLFLIVTLSITFSLRGYAQDSKTPLYQKARIHYNTNTGFIKLLESEIAIDHGIKRSKGYIESVFLEREIKLAKKLGFQVDILIEDMQSYFTKRAEENVKINTKNPVPCDDTTIDYNTPVNFNLGSMGGYLTYAEVLQELDDMHSLYPNLITAKAAISTFTTENGNTLQWVKISDNPNSNEAEPEILYNALHHAREPASMQQLIFYMWYLLENYATNSEVKNIVDNTALYFIPVVNPDGYLYNESTNPNGGGLWRKNRKDNGNGTFGVDNNRNYNYHIDGNPANGSWGGNGSSSTTSSEIYRGTSPFSEIENQAMKWFIEQHDFKIALNNHTFGELIYFPFGYADVATPDENFYYALTNEYNSQNGYNSIRGNPFSGDSDDYMYGTVGTHNKIIAMTPEIGTSFWPAQNEIIPICKRMVFTNLTAANTVNNYGVVLDTQENYFTNITGTIDYSLQRLGVTGTGDFSVSIVPISSNITAIGNSNQHNALSLLESRSGTISYQLNSEIVVGELIEYKLVIDNGIYTSEKLVSKVMGPASFNLNDTANNLMNWTSSNWNVTTSEFVSASRSLTDSPSANYTNNLNSTIELTNDIDLTNAGIASLDFFAKWDIEAGFDYVQFEVSTDNGTTWEPQCGTHTGIGNSLQGINEQPMYDGVQNEWVLEQINLSNYLGETIKVRFQLVSDSSINRDGFYFDDFKISTIDQSALSASSQQKINIKVYPNPVEDNLTIVLPNATETSIKIYGINGQLIKKSKTSLLSTQIGLQNLSQGIYVLNIENADGMAIYKVVKK